MTATYQTAHFCSIPVQAFGGTITLDCRVILDSEYDRVSGRPAPLGLVRSLVDHIQVTGVTWEQSDNPDVYAVWNAIEWSAMSQRSRDKILAQFAPIEQTIVEHIHY